MNKNQRKRLIEKEALMLAKEIINDEKHVKLSCIKEGVPEKIIVGYEKCLLKKYNIKSLKVDGHDYVRVYVLASFSESKQYRIMEDVKEMLPALESERMHAEEEQKMLRELQEEAYNSFAMKFLKWLFDDQDDDIGAHDEEDNMSAN